MAVLETSGALTEGVRISDRISAVLRNSMNGVVKWNNARLTRNALSQLSEQALDDIGLTSFDVTRI